MPARDSVTVQVPLWVAKEVLQWAEQGAAEYSHQTNEERDEAIRLLRERLEEVER